MNKARNITSNIKTTYSIMSLGLLTILALAVLFIPAKTEAMTGGVNYIYGSPYNTNSVNYNQNPYNYPIYQPPVQTYYPPVNTQTNYTIPTVDSTRKVAQATTKKSSATTVKTSQEEDEYKNLAANTIFGEIGFLPSGLFQWILFAILILLIVILTRRIFGGSKRYHEIPLKKA